MRAFDPRAVGRLECRAWETYYQRRWGALLIASVSLVRESFRMNWPRTLVGAWLVLRANQKWAPYPDNDPDAARREMEGNYFGVLNMTRAFAPLLAANDGGYMVNVLSVAGAFPAPFMGGYSPAKAAALFLSSITRSELADQGTEAIALIVGSVDTRMAGHVQGRKEDPRDIVRAGLDALDRGEHVTDTDFMAIDARARYARDPGRYERGMTKLLKATVMDTGR